MSVEKEVNLSLMKMIKVKVACSGGLQTFRMLESSMLINQTDLSENVEHLMRILDSLVDLK